MEENLIFAEEYVSTTGPHIHVYQSKTTTSLECIIDVVALIASIFLIYTIARFKILKSRTNYFIMHYAIANVMFFTITPLYEIMAGLMLSQNISSSLVCTVYQIERLGLYLTLFFATALAFDWCVLMYRREWILSLWEAPKLAIAGVYLLGLFKYALFVTECFTYTALHSNFFIQVSFGVMLISVLFINCLTFRNRKEIGQEALNLKYSLNVATFVVFSYFPLYCTYFLECYLKDFEDSRFDKFVKEVLPVIDYLLRYVVYAGPVFVLVLLERSNVHFKKAFRNILKRSHVDRDALDDDSDDNNTNYVNQSKHVDCSSEEI